MKKIAILGSTGSIGTQTLEVVREQKDIEVTALSAGKNISLLEQQIREFHPHLVSVQNEDLAKDLKDRVSDLPVEISGGLEGLLAVAQDPESEILVTGIVGMIGIRPTIAAIKAGKDIALANKETLVCAGHIIMPLAKKEGVKILPVDSEHSAIFQSLQGNAGNPIARILLTASGGPFRGKTRQELEHVTVEDALHHPNWTMGNKVTIDSATMVNKGLEVMEAKWLFGVSQEQIQVVVHPQSILHSAVQFADGAVIGQMGLPDMKIPIQYALCYPQHRPMPGDKLDLFEASPLTFEQPDEDTFEGLRFARKALRRGGNMPTVFNAANERAVSLFLHGRIGFLQIADMIYAAMEQAYFVPSPSVDDILETQAEVDEYISKSW